MNHRIFGKKLGRNHHQRQALLKTLSHSLFQYGAIETTDAKAKAVVSLVERLCSIAVKKDSLLASREFGRYFQDRNFVKATINAIKDAYGTQQLNFTRFVPSHRRQGDDALIVKLTFTKPLIVKADKTIAAEAKKPEIKKEAPVKIKKTAKAPLKKTSVKKVKSVKKA